VAYPEVNEQGPHAVYEKIRRALGEFDGETAIPLSMIGVLDDNADLVRLLGVALSTGPGPYGNPNIR